MIRQFQRLLSIILILTLVLLVTPDQTWAATTSDGFIYELSGGLATITGYTGTGGDITIPAAINSVPVTRIAERAFFGCTTIKKVTIGSQVAIIGDSAFSGCTGLTSVMLPASVTGIGCLAFAQCPLLATAYFFGNRPFFCADPAFAGAAVGFKVYFHVSHRADWVNFTLFPCQAFCKLVLEPQNGSVASSRYVPVSNGKIAQPASPIRPGYSFAGWFKEAAGLNRFDFTTTTVVNDLTLYAKWIALSPAIPGLPRAASYSATSNRISWQAAAYASGYQIYRSTDMDGSFLFLTTTSSTSYINTGLVTNQLYCYKIRSYRTIGTSRIYSAFSMVVSARPIPITPTNFKAASESYNSIKLTWVAVTGASGYKIIRSTSSTGTYVLVTTITSGSTVTYTNTSLATGSTYYYKIRAYSTVGTAKIYSIDTAAISGKPIPSIPTNLKVISGGSKTAKATWTAVAGASGYEVYRKMWSTGAYTMVSRLTATSLTNSGLTINKTYYYKVRAYRIVGTTKVYGPDSAVATYTPLS